MIRAAITPGTQAQRVSIKTIRKEPHPLSTTDKGGNIIAKITRKRFMSVFASNNQHVRPSRFL